MKKVSKLSVIALAAVLVGCNEKVSPELQQGNATTPETAPAPPEVYSFSITDASPVLLNYRLHKTGPGNGNTKCEISSTTPLSNDFFRGNTAANDITCFLEAEELALMNGGLSFDINASKNTCDYIAYTPFSFYDYIPGDSSGSYTKITCGSKQTTSTHIDSLFPNLRDGQNNPLNCGEWINTGQIPAGSRERFQIEKDEDLCAFDYSVSGGPNCDVGVINITEINVTYTPETDSEPASTTAETSVRTVRCGGRIQACVEGPIRRHHEEAAFYTLITETEVNQPVKINYTYPGLIGERSSVKLYANYRRQLASWNLDYSVVSNWGSATLGKTFDPRVMDYFSNNKMFDNQTALVPYSVAQQQGRTSNKWSQTPLAADPYLGISQKVSPFYTFYCLDTAMDIKARIRMVVREWDRIYPSNTSELEWLSDIFRGTSARMDNPNGVELPDDNDSLILYNDLEDWDDLVPMQRTPGPVWTPVPNSEFPNGWFNPEYFPQGNL